MNFIDLIAALFAAIQHADIFSERMDYDRQASNSVLMFP
jgi:hypothetical protein